MHIRVLNRKGVFLCSRHDHHMPHNNFGVWCMRGFFSAEQTMACFFSNNQPLLIVGSTHKVNQPTTRSIHEKLFYSSFFYPIDIKIFFLHPVRHFFSLRSNAFQRTIFIVTTGGKKENEDEVFILFFAAFSSSVATATTSSWLSPFPCTTLFYVTLRRMMMSREARRANYDTTRRWKERERNKTFDIDPF